MISFENENIQLDVEKQPGCKVVFSIKTLPLATKAADAAAIKEVSKAVNIPGFRKGRAPANLVVDRYKPQIKNEFDNILTRNALFEAFKVSKIHPLNQKEQVKLVKCEPIDNTTYLVVFEFIAYPEIPSIDPAHLTIEKQEPKAVTEEAVNTHLEELCLHHCTWETIENRAAQEGDYATLKIDMLGENDQLETIYENTKLPLKEGKIPGWLHRLALGKNIGETATGVSEAEEDDPYFKPKSFQIQILKIERPIPAPLNDELAQKAGAQDVGALRIAVQKSLEKDAAKKIKQTERLSIKQQLLEKNPFDLPGNRLKDLLKSCNQAVDEDPRELTKEQKETEAMKLFNTEKNNLAFSYLLSQIFLQHKLPRPSAEQIRARATEEMLLRYMQGNKNISESDMEYYSVMADNEIAAETALDFLIAQCKTTSNVNQGTP